MDAYIVYTAQLSDQNILVTFHYTTYIINSVSCLLIIPIIYHWVVFNHLVTQSIGSGVLNQWLNLIIFGMPSDTSPKLLVLPGAHSAASPDDRSLKLGCLKSKTVKGGRNLLPCRTAGASEIRRENHLGCIKNSAYE